MPVLLLAVSVCFFVFSYFWVDKALILTLASGHPVVKNLETLNNFGDVKRENFALVYALLIIAFFILQAILILKNKRSFFLVMGATTLIFSFSYNFLSYDLFTYLFSAKMVWNYHLNPYVVTPEYLVPVDFSISFLRNIQHIYLYGFSALFYSLISTIIFSGERIILNIFATRILNAVLFYVTGVVIYKTLNDKRVFGWWFFNPLLILELLINAHNDLLLVSFFIIAVCLFYRKKIKIGLLILLSAALAKSSNVIFEALIFSAGGLFAFLKEKYLVIFSKLAILGILLFLQTSNLAVQVWYYTWVYCFVPFAKLKTSSLIILGILGMILLIGYYPYIKTGGWGGEALIPGTKLLGIVMVLMIGYIEFGHLIFAKTGKD